MAIVTFMSDFGSSDHYTAAVKAKILSINPGLNIVDISHGIESCNIAHGSFVLKSVFRDFPQGTVHIAAVNSVNKENAYLAIMLEGHYFVGPDNGLFGLISDQGAVAIVDINSVNKTFSNFPTKDILAPVAAKLASGTDIYSLGNTLSQFKKMLGRHMRATKKMISGHVVRVDHYGNLTTNIEKQAFEILSKGKKFNITFGRERSRHIHSMYTSVDAGDCFVIFNSLGLLEIGINQGNASELLGLEFDSPVMINFEE